MELTEQAQEREEFRQILLRELVERSTYFHSLRHHFHMYPEETTQEEETARFISSILTEHGITHTCNVANEHGIVAIIEGEHDGPVIALRADMDALEITEETGLTYASQHPHLMHACGHDFHMASVLATGLLLNAHRHKLKGTVKLLFQPAEENGPRGGAKSMINSGVMEDPFVDVIFASHVFPSIPRGTLWIPPGPVMAAVDNFVITVTGKGGHAAMPELSIDPIAVSAHLVLALNYLVPKNIAAKEQAVISLGRIEGGNRRNIIPDNVIIEGTMRTFSSATRDQLKRNIHLLTKQIPVSFRATGTIAWSESYGPTINDTKIATLATDAITEISDSYLLVESGTPQMTAEDFGSFLTHRPGAFILFGVGDESSGSLHSSKLNIADGVLDEMITMYIGIISMSMQQIIKNERSIP